MKFLLRVAGAVTTVVGLGAILWSKLVQGWAGQHPRVLFGALVALTSACIILAEMWWRERIRPRPLAEPVGRKPTQRDKDLFAKFLHEFSADKGAIVYLRSGFFGKQWYWSRLEEVARFASGWETGIFFDDPQVDTARQELLSACQNFMSDAAGESDTPGENDDVARLKEAHYRHGGQVEWQAARDLLNEEADAVLSAHETLHRVGRAQGL